MTKLALLLLLLAPAGAGADVPRACVHPSAQRLECIRETRRVRLDVLPSARVRALERQREQLAAEVPAQDVERNALLREIRDTYQGAAGPTRGSGSAGPGS